MELKPGSLCDLPDSVIRRRARPKQRRSADCPFVSPAEEFVKLPEAYCVAMIEDALVHCLVYVLGKPLSDRTNPSALYVEIGVVHVNVIRHDLSLSANA